MYAIRSYYVGNKVYFAKKFRYFHSFLMSDFSLWLKEIEEFTYNTLFLGLKILDFHEKEDSYNFV